MPTVSLSFPASVWAPPDDTTSWNSAQLQIKQSSASVPSPRWVEWLFDDTTDEHIVTTLFIPGDFVSVPSLYVYYKMASATSSSVRWAAQIHALTHNDSVDLDADAFATEAAASGVVPATAGHIRVTRILFLTNDDGIAAQDYVTLVLRRDPDHADDGASGDAEFIGADFRYEV